MGFEIWVPLVFVGLAGLASVINFGAPPPLGGSRARDPQPAEPQDEDAAVDNLDFVDGAPPSGYPPVVANSNRPIEERP